MRRPWSCSAGCACQRFLRVGSRDENQTGDHMCIARSGTCKTGAQFSVIVVGMPRLSVDYCMLRFNSLGLLHNPFAAESPALSSVESGRPRRRWMERGAIAIVHLSHWWDPAREDRKARRLRLRLRSPGLPIPPSPSETHASLMAVLLEK